MNNKEFLNALNEIDERYVNEATEYNVKSRRSLFLKLGALAACLCICIVAVLNPFGQEFTYGSSSGPETGSVPGVPPLQFTSRTFYSKDEFVTWIKAGGKWEGEWGSGYYNSEYDSAYEKNLFYNAAVKNGYFPEIRLKVSGDYKYYYTVSADNYSYFTCLSQDENEAGTKSCRIIIYVIPDEHKELSIEDKAKICGIVGDWIPKEAINVYSDSDEIYNKYGEYVTVNSYEYEKDKFKVPRIIIEKDNFLIDASAVGNVDDPLKIFDYFEVAFEKINT
ncbi:MAG: hypothetical protein IJD95_01155 [Clostridia bacterium]|nr:hypothetical protein [Clostridia bacterium]